MKNGSRQSIRWMALILTGLVLAGCGGGGSVPTPAGKQGEQGPGPGPAAGGESGPVAGGDSGPVAGAPAPCTSTALDPEAGRHGTGITLRTPENPAPSATTPWLRYLTVGHLETLPGGGMVLGDTYLVRPGTAVVPALETVVRVELTPALPESWYAEHLLLEGITPSDRQVAGMGDWGTLSLRLPPGKAGDRFTITFRNVIDSEGKVGDYAVSFCRQAPPRAELHVRSGDDWRPAAAGLPEEGPVKFRISFTSQMRRATVAEALLESPKGQSNQAIESLTWSDDRTLELTVKASEPVVALNLVGSQDLNGLYAVGGLPRAYRGEPARLVAVDPASNQTRTLAELPHEVRGTRLLPDGRRVFVHTLQYLGGYESHPSFTTVLVSVDGGKPEQIAAPERVWAQWLTDGEQVELRRDRGRLTLVRHSASGRSEQELKDLPDYFETYLSPDGRWLVLMAQLPQTGEYSAWTRNSVLVIDLSTGARQELKERVDLLRPGKDGIWIPTPTWSPDSSRLVIPQGRDGVPEVVILDPASGSLRMLSKGKELGGHLLWSPDSKRLLVGQTLLDATTGQPLHQVNELWGAVAFSPDGTRLLLGEGEGGDWGGIRVYSLQTGTGQSLGEGRPVGWSPAGEVLIVRWAAYRHRVIQGL